MDHNAKAREAESYQRGATMGGAGVMGGGGGSMPTPNSTRTLGIPSQIESISAELAKAEETLAHLYHRLDHVMRGAAPETRGDDAADRAAGPASSMETDLAQIRYRISSLTSAINQITIRLEL